MSGDQAVQSMTVEGALLGAPLSIQLLQYCFYLLWVTAVVGSLFYLGFEWLPIFVVSLGLLAFWIFIRNRERFKQLSEPPILRATPQAFFLSSDLPMVVQRVTRHWSGMTLTLRPDKALSVNQHPQKNRITIWRARWSRDDYRRLSVLVNWQLRGSA